jgi:hypothetical protein
MRAASSSSYTPKPRAASSSSSIPAAPGIRPRQRATPQTPRPPSSEVNGAIDPQAAIPAAATVADVDPALAAQIPTPDSASANSSGSTPFGASAFTAALSSANGNGASTATIDWSSSFHGLSTTPFSPETAAVLMQPLDPRDIEIKPDGIIYLPEIKYRRILNRAFGPGGWGLAPRGELVVGEKVVTREFALVVHGR